MNNLHRELAPISEAAWADIEAEARRTFTRHLAGRRVVDLHGPAGPSLSAAGTGHVQDIAPPADGVQARQRRVQPIVELRAPFTVNRQAVDDVERGAKDADWQPVKDAAKKMALAEDAAIFDGFSAAGITGIRGVVTNPVLTFPPDLRGFPNTVSQALSVLRLAGVAGPYALLLSADAYTAITETVDQGYPIYQHIARLLDGEIVWAPAISGAFVVSTRGGDFELHLGQDLSIGYLSHDEATVALYLQESMTFLAYTAEAAVAVAVPHTP
jgi:uncharacterized linocin/CFP29 family protein